MVNNYFWPSVIGEYLSFIVFAILVILLVLFIHGYNNRSKSIEMSKLILVLAFGCLISFALSVLSRALYFHYFIQIEFDTFPDEIHHDLVVWVWVDFFQSFLWNLGNSFCYLLFLRRLHETFKDTVYEISAIIKIMIVVLVIAFLCFAVIIIPSFMHVFLQANVFADDDHATLLYNAYRTGTNVLDFIINVWLLLIFIRKLKLITIKLNDYDDEMTEVYSSNDKQDKLVDVISKTFLLSVLMITSTQITRILGFIYNAFKEKYGNYSSINVLYNIMKLIRTFDCLIGAVCIFLIFVFNQKYYDKYCSICHNKIKQCCVNKIEKEIEKEIEMVIKKSQTLEDSDTKYL